MKAYFIELKSRMRRQGLPVSYVKKSSCELLDHYQSLKEELVQDGQRPEQAQQQALEQLGRADEVASAYVSALRQQRLAGRYPYLFFPVLPALFAFAAWILCFFISFILYYVLNNYHFTLPSEWHALIPYQAGLKWLCFGGMAWITYGRIYQTGLSQRWQWITVAFFSVCMLLLFSWVSPPLDGPGSGVFMLGWLLGKPAYIQYWDWIGACIPIALYLLHQAVVIRESKRERILTAI